MMDRKSDWIGLCIQQALKEEERSARSRARIVAVLAVAVIIIAASLTIRLSQPPVSFAPGLTQMGGSARE